MIAAIDGNNNGQRDLAGALGPPLDKTRIHSNVELNTYIRKVNFVFETTNDKHAPVEKRGTTNTSAFPLQRSS